MTATTIILATLAVALLALAIGMLVRDLLKPRSMHPEFPQLDEESQNDFDRSFSNLVRDAGLTLDVNTALALIVGVGVICGAAGFVALENSLAVAFGFGVGVLLPLTVFVIMRWRRLAVLRGSLPEALQVVADSVRSGRNLEQAAEMVASELEGPISEEFSASASRLKLGNSPVVVMEQMANRIPLPEFRVFATAVMVHQMAGGNLALLTERMAHAARDRQELFGHLRAVTSGSRLSAIGIALGSILAVVSLVWLQPEYVSAFLSNEMGPTLLTIAACLQLIGALWVWRVMRVIY